MSPQMVQLLTTAENVQLPLHERSAAIRQIGDMRDKVVVARLCRLLSQDFDVVTFETIIALDKIGDPAALPALDQLSEGEDLQIPGQVNVVLRRTITRLRASDESQAP
jgi:HEAT repeat protein